MRILGVAEMRVLDEAASARVGELALVRAAAYGVFTESLRLLKADGRQVSGAVVLVLAGSGHNAADALFAGALLARRGCAVRVARTGSGDGDAIVQAGLAAALAAGARTADPDLHPALVVDGMTGLGARGGLRGPAAVWAQRLEGTPCVAVDLPSGVAADTGAVDGTVLTATTTVTFGAAKIGLVVGAGAQKAGRVVLVDAGLGISVDGPWQTATAPVLAPPPMTADKYTRGVVGVLAGSADYPGAAVLCVGGAVRGGAGYVRVLGDAAPAAVTRWPSAVPDPGATGRLTALVVGPGGVDALVADAALARNAGVPAVVDAGALAGTGWHHRPRTLITPHAKELGRLVDDDVEGDPFGSALRAAARFGVHVLLKGSRTVVATPGGRAAVLPASPSWLSTAGTGDVLAGLIGARLAADPDGDLLQVAVDGAWWHARAAELLRGPLAADQLPDAIHAVLVAAAAP